jgi:hypothetical protein
MIQKERIYKFSKSKISYLGCLRLKAMTISAFFSFGAAAFVVKFTFLFTVSGGYKLC